MKRVIAGMAAVLLAAVLVFPCHGVSAKNAIVTDALTGRVIYEKAPDERSLIASTTKIMTALIICEQCNVLDRVRIPKEAVGVEGSSIYLKEGEILSIQELLYGMMLHSGNDAAVALAIYCAGTVEGFAELMNDKAFRLGMRQTHFVNPNGLDAPGHYSTARDLSLLAAYAMKNPIFARTVSAKTVNITGRNLRNHNKLLWQFQGADGVKTGYTKAAGRILVSSATRHDRRLIAVTINDPNDWSDHKLLLEKGFLDYSVQTIITAGTCLGTAEIAGGQDAVVHLIAEESFSYALTAGEKPQIVLNGPGFVYAPVTEGQQAGYAYVCIGDQTVGKVALKFGETVEQEVAQKQSIWTKLFGGKCG